MLCGLCGDAVNSNGNALAQAIGAVLIGLGAVFAFIALARVFEDVEFIREIVFKFEAFGVYSLWFVAIILIAIGYYVFRAE